jgi:hypothetical protein
VFTPQPSSDSIRRVFTRGFRVRDIAEVFVSVDSTSDTQATAKLMDQNDFDVIGLRKEGRVTGYVRREDLGTGTISDVVRKFTAEQVVSDSDTLAEVVAILTKQPRVFVNLLGHVGGIVTRDDLLKAPVRMWLFGMVTLLEMRFTDVIQAHFEGDTWCEFLSESRVEKARKLLEERQRRNRGLGLIECLQLSDKGQIIAKNENLRVELGIPSRNRAEKIVSMLEALRNSLAHSQDILACDWETIVALSTNLDRVLTM